MNSLLFLCTNSKYTKKLSLTIGVSLNDSQVDCKRFLKSIALKISVYEDCWQWSAKNVLKFPQVKWNKLFGSQILSDVFVMSISFHWESTCTNDFVPSFGELWSDLSFTFWQIIDWYWYSSVSYAELTIFSTSLTWNHSLKLHSNENSFIRIHLLPSINTFNCYQQHTFFY